MFTSISWQLYLLAITTLVTLYYSGVLLVYYRVEIAAILNWKMDRHIEFESTNPNSNSVLGETRQDNQGNSFSQEDLQFSSESDSQSTQRNH